MKISFTGYPIFFIYWLSLTYCSINVVLLTKTYLTQIKSKQKFNLKNNHVQPGTVTDCPVK